MAIRDNYFSQGDYEGRLERLSHFNANIDRFAVELGLPDDLLL